MKLILAEKPGLAKAIAAALPGRTQWQDGAYHNGEYVVVYSFGHLLTLKMPGDYDESLKKWDLSQLPIFFPNWEKKVKDQSYGDDRKGKETPADRLKLIQKYLREADMVIHAGDPDDEGQYLIDEILEYCDYQGPVKRLSTNETEPQAIQRAFVNMDDNREHIRVGRSAYARSVADLMVGVNLSRYFTLNNPEVLLTIGRVQTPTLGLVVELDRQIENHVQIKYYTVVANLDIEGHTILATYQPRKDDPNLTDGRILEPEYAKKISEMVAGIQNGTASVISEMEKESPPLPFNLTKLKVYCESHFGYTPDETLDITQALRDKYNCISYNRTDCQYLSSDQFEQAPGVMEVVVKNIGFSPSGMDMAIRSRAFDDNYVKSDGDVAHLAIIPQKVEVDLSKMTERERNVYLAICKYYMAQFMPPAQKCKTKLTMPTPDGATLTATSTKIVSPGYRSIFKEMKNDGKTQLSGIEKGQHTSSVINTELKEGITKPPSRYTQATLGEEMSKIAKHVTDPEIKQILLEKDKNHREENGSIGTEATRSKIVSGLIAHQFIEEDSKKRLRATPLGKELYRILPPQLTKPDLTALWWCIQEDIKSGKATEETLTANVLAMINDMLAEPCPHIDLAVVPPAYRRKGGGAAGNRTEVGTCPRCGKPVIEGKKGFGCSGYKEGCKFVLWKTSKRPMLKNVTFTATDAKKLISGGAILKNNLAKTAGGTFSAYLVMKDDPSSPYGANIEPDFSRKLPAKRKTTSKSRSKKY